MRSDNELDLMFRRGMIEKGFLMFPMAMKRNHVMYTMTDEDAARTLEAAEDVMKTMAGRRSR
jgi:glutamate-1-semialdehyde 2,1-aminomutase